jgi:phage terminase large subunit
MLTHINLPHKFDPRHYQRDLFHAFFVKKIKRLITVWHRRAGKSKAAINLLTGSAFREVGLYYHAFPELKQARKIVWKGIDSDGKRWLDHIPKKLIKGKPNNTEMTINLINGSIIQVVGSDNYDSLVGSNPRGIIFDEYSIQNPLAWEYMRPILTENKGWAYFPYTPRGKNHGFDLYEFNKNNTQWFTQKLGVNDTFRNDGSHVITQEDIEDDIRGGMPDEMVEQEYHVSFDAALPGAYFAKEMRAMESSGRVGDFPFNPQLPVFTFWDIGTSDSTVITFMQFQSGKIVVIDYYEYNNQGMQHYLTILKDKETKHGYRYAAHYAPHDMANTEWGAGKTRLQQAQEKGVNFHVVPRTKNKQEDIDRLRNLFSRIHLNVSLIQVVRSRNDSIVGCNHLKSALVSYHREYDVKRKIFLDQPKHDWASHPVDSMFCMASACRDWFDNPASQPRVVITDYPSHHP